MADEKMFVIAVPARFTVVVHAPQEKAAKALANSSGV